MSDVEKTLAERGARYGDFTHHAAIAQQLQDIMRGPSGRWENLSYVQAQALTVIADKIARILSGDPDYTDNWHDIQGYAKLAEDRCVDHTAPQLPLLGADVHDDFEHFPNEHDPLAGQHLARREGDEYVCSRCHKRWDVNEDAPETCA